MAGKAKAKAKAKGKAQQDPPNPPKDPEKAEPKKPAITVEEVDAALQRMDTQEQVGVVAEVTAAEARRKYKARKERFYRSMKSTGLNPIQNQRLSKVPTRQQRSRRNTRAPCLK